MGLSAFPARCLCKSAKRGQMGGRRRRSRCHLGQLGLPDDGGAETVSGLELFAAGAVCCFFLRAVRKVVSPPRVSTASVVQPMPVHTHGDEAAWVPWRLVGAAAPFVDWRAVGPSELFLWEVMVKPVMG